MEYIHRTFSFKKICEEVIKENVLNISSAFRWECKLYNFPKILICKMTFCPGNISLYL